MTPSSQVYNVRRSILAFLIAGLIDIAVTTPEDARFDTDSVASFVRVQIRDLATQDQRVDGGQIGWRTTLVLDCECYAKTTDNAEEIDLSAAYLIGDQVTDLVRVAPGRGSSIPVLDWAGDPEADPTAELQYLRTLPSPTLPPIEGWQRRIVSFVFNYRSIAG